MKMHRICQKVTTKLDKMVYGKCLKIKMKGNKGSL